MNSFSLTHVVDHVLLKNLAALVTQDRATAALLLAHIAEVEERKLHAPASHASMFLYCVHELHMSEDVAYKRIRAARAARKFPAIFEAIAGGRLNVNAVVLLAPFLKSENAAELLTAATHKTRSEIELLLAHRFPQPDLPTLMRAIAPGAGADCSELQLAAAPPQHVSVEGVAPSLVPDLSTRMEPLAARPAVPSRVPEVTAAMEPLPMHAKITPRAPDRFALQTMVNARTNELMLYAQALLGHTVAPGNLPELIERAFEALVDKLERQKFAKCARSGRQRGSADPRYVPTRVRRAVWERDGGQCTFVSDTGKRCEARARLEFDHVLAVARGGQSTARDMRLLCRTHNQLAADRTFGAGFMREKRRAARFRATQAREPSRTLEGGGRAAGSRAVLSSQVPPEGPSWPDVLRHSRGPA